MKKSFFILLSLVAVAASTSFAQWDRPGRGDDRRGPPGRGDHGRPGPYPSRGRACFYQDRNFGGQVFCLNVGDRAPYLKAYGWNDNISSIRIEGNATAVVYADSYNQGPSLTITRDVWNLREYGDFWNDRISAIEIYR